MDKSGASFLRGRRPIASSDIGGATSCPRTSPRHPGVGHRDDQRHGGWRWTAPSSCSRTRSRRTPWLTPDREAGPAPDGEASTAGAGPAAGAPKSVGAKETGALLHQHPTAVKGAAAAGCRPACSGSGRGRARRASARSRPRHTLSVPGGASARGPDTAGRNGRGTGRALAPCGHSRRRSTPATPVPKVSASGRADRRRPWPAPARRTPERRTVPVGPVRAGAGSRRAAIARDGLCRGHPARRDDRKRE